MAVLCARIGVLLFALAPIVATAPSHTGRIEALYSSADGSVQYVVLREMQGLTAQRLLAGKSLALTHAGVTKTFTFPFNLPSDATAWIRLV